MEFSPTVALLATALADAQGKMRNAAKDSTNPHFKSRYADLASVWEACREALSGNGLAVVQTVAARGTEVMVATALLHKSGEWVRDTLTLTAQQNTPQAIGSCITYGRRFSLAAIAGIAPDEDDDGNAATHRNAPQHVTSRPQLALAVMPPAPAVAAPSNAADDMRMRYNGMRARLVALFGELRTRVLVKEFTDSAGTDRELILTKMREAIAEEDRRNQPKEATNGQ